MEGASVELSSMEKTACDVVNFYMDDSGTRHPDHKRGKRAKHDFDWFALGGVLVKEDDEPEARRLHEVFCQKWGLNSPIHSVEVRSRTQGFLWLERRPKRDQDIFYEDLYQLIKDSPVVGLVVADEFGKIDGFDRVASTDGRL